MWAITDFWCDLPLGADEQDNVRLTIQLIIHRHQGYIWYLRYLCAEYRAFIASDLYGKDLCNTSVCYYTVPGVVIGS